MGALTSTHRSTPRKTSNMGDIERLPPEIQLLVFAEFDQESMISFCRTSSRSHEVMIPILYRQIWYWSEKEDVCIKPRDRYHDKPSKHGDGSEGLYPYERYYLAEIQRDNKTENWSAAICDKLRKGSKLFRPTALTRTLRKSALLRSLVESVDIIWDCREEDRCLYALLKSLTSSPLKHLHISPARNVFRAPPGANVTSLGFRHEYIDDKASLRQFCTSSLALPSLRHVHFDSWYDFGYHPWSMHHFTENTFNITALCFYRCNIPDHELDWIISRIRALRSFRYYTNYEPDDEDDFSPTPSEEQLRRSLNIHRLTLEEIVISILYNEEHAEFAVHSPISFHKFPVLERLRINLEYLLPGFPLGSRYSGRDYRIIESIPHTLEALSLEYLEKSVYSKSPDAQATEQQDLKRLFRYIEELEIDARSHAPVLKSVSLGDRRLDLHKAMDFFAGLRDVNENFEAMGVALSAYHPRLLRGFGENQGARKHYASSLADIKR